MRFIESKGETGDAAREQPVVLLAEDNDDARQIYGLILRHGGYRVEEATNGTDAVAIARTSRPNLVLMDIGLPGLDGWEASHILKSDPSTSTIPVIAFSARVACTEDLAGRLTFDGYIMKPIGPQELVRRIDAYLRRQ